MANEAPKPHPANIGELAERGAHLTRATKIKEGWVRTIGTGEVRFGKARKAPNPQGDGSILKTLATVRNSLKAQQSELTEIRGQLGSQPEAVQAVVDQRAEEITLMAELSSINPAVAEVLPKRRTAYERILYFAGTTEGLKGNIKNSLAESGTVFPPQDGTITSGKTDIEIPNPDGEKPKDEPSNRLVEFLRQEGKTRILRIGEKEVGIQRKIAAVLVELANAGDNGLTHRQLAFKIRREGETTEREMELLPNTLSGAKRVLDTHGTDLKIETTTRVRKDRPATLKYTLRKEEAAATETGATLEDNERPPLLTKIKSEGRTTRFRLRNGKEVLLSRFEERLARLLSEDPENLSLSKTLQQEIWPKAPRENASKSLNTLISNLRAKFQSADMDVVGVHYVGGKGEKGYYLQTVESKQPYTATSPAGEPRGAGDVGSEPAAGNPGASAAGESGLSNKPEPVTYSLGEGTEPVTGDLARIFSRLDPQNPGKMLPTGELFEGTTRRPDRLLDDGNSRLRRLENSQRISAVREKTADGEKIVGYFVEPNRPEIDIEVFGDVIRRSDGQGEVKLPDGLYQLFWVLKRRPASTEKIAESAFNNPALAAGIPEEIAELNQQLAPITGVDDLILKIDGPEKTYWKMNGAIKHNRPLHEPLKPERLDALAEFLNGATSDKIISTLGHMRGSEPQDFNRSNAFRAVRNDCLRALNRYDAGVASEIEGLFAQELIEHGYNQPENLLQRLIAKFGERNTQEDLEVIRKYRTPITDIDPQS